MKKFFHYLLIVGCCGIFAATVIVCLIFSYYSINLPQHASLQDYQPPVTSRVYSSDGVLLKEYAEENRLFVAIEDIPDLVKHAFIAAEDKNFYRNNGLDVESLFSAAIYSVYAYFNGLQLRGGSTITQQVVKNMLLSNERTLQRKIKEAILSLRITRDFGKDKVLELYLNHIFLGNNTYGVAAAALTYFDKSLDELQVEEVALLAAMPKAPGKMSPIKNPDRALARRNWVLGRMRKDGYITRKQYEEALKTEIVLKSKKQKDECFNYGAFIEEVRKNMLSKFDEKSLMQDGLVISSTIEPKVQKALDKALKDGLEMHDRRHGYRGAMGNILDSGDGKYVKDMEAFQNEWPERLKNFELTEYYRDGWKRAVVLKFDDEKQRIVIGLLGDGNSKKIENTTELNGENMSSSENSVETEDKAEETDEETMLIGSTEVKKSFMLFSNVKWAVDAATVTYKEVDESGNEITKTRIASSIRDLNLNVGDVIFVKKAVDAGAGYLLRIAPLANGAAVALDVHSGRVLGMVGGYIDSEINFNRATQAKRQPGSTIKPFVYLTALENGYKPSDTIMDEEIALPQGYGLPTYRPHNYNYKYNGLVTLRKALQSSYNVSTVRLASELGLRKVVNTIRRFGVNRRPKRVYSVVLGSLETHLIDMTKAYAILINGGKAIDMETVEKVQDKYGKTVFRRDRRKCNHCIADENKKMEDLEVPFLEDERETIVDAASAYQLTYMLEGAVKYGTAWRAQGIEKPVGAKTGTSNNFRDAWFIGFSPDIVVGVYIGYDDNRSLGDGETGSRAAAPTFTEAMNEILEDQPATPFRIPNNITFRKIDMLTGREPTLVSNKNNIILEAFKIEDDFNDEKIKRDENQDILNEFGVDMDYIREEYGTDVVNSNEDYEDLEEEENKSDRQIYDGDVNFNGGGDYENDNDNYVNSLVNGDGDDDNDSNDNDDSGDGDEDDNAIDDRRETDDSEDEIIGNAKDIKNIKNGKGEEKSDTPADGFELFDIGRR